MRRNLLRSKMNSGRRGSFVTLQIGRGLAAMAVAAFHLGVFMSLPELGGTGENPYARLFGRGFLGVDFFFVLSGFIILQAHRRDIGTGQTRRYLTRRFLRIYPIYWGYLLVCIAGMAAVGSSHLQLHSAGDWATPFTLIRWTTVELPLDQAWTLFHEILFYAVFAALIIDRRVGALLMGAWMMAALFGLMAGISEVQPVSFYTVLANPQNLNFAIGMAACYFVEKQSRRVAWLVLAAGFLVLAIAARESYDPANQVVYAMSFGLLISGAAAMERHGALRPPLWLGFIGDASYSIYLLHEHLQTYGLRALRKIGLTSHGAMLFAIVFAITVIGGCLAYQFLERPLLRWLRAKLEPKQVGMQQPQS